MVVKLVLLNSCHRCISEAFSHKFITLMGTKNFMEDDESGWACFNLLVLKPAGNPMACVIAGVAFLSQQEVETALSSGKSLSFYCEFFLMYLKH